MRSMKEDRDRESRISDDVVVDAYNEIERALGWYYYLKEKCQFPFRARCIATQEESPLRRGEEVKVYGLAPEAKCENDMLVRIEFQGRRMAVPLSQLSPAESDGDTLEAVADWHYWVRRGYQF